jgi:hypothetical protein
MGKLFNLKEWLTVADAARHLSIVFGEDVTEADVLRLGLDKRLRLSIFLAGDYVYAKRVHKRPIPEFLTTKSENFHCELDHDWWLSVEDDQIFRLAGVLDLPMIALDRLEIENEYRRLINGTEVGSDGGEGIYIEDNGQLYALYDQHPPPWHMEIAPPGGIEQYMRQSAMKNYSLSEEIPGHSIIVVRTQALRELEASLNTTSTSPEKPLETTERNTLLTLIAALCADASINPQDRGAAGRIVRMTEALGAPVSDDTVRRWLVKIPDAVESRMK